MKKKVIALYLDNEPVRNIALDLKIDVGTIYNILKRNNIKPKTNREVDVLKLIEDYKTTSITELAKIYKKSQADIKQILVNNGVNTNKTYRRYTVNENYFECVDTIDKAYFLGLLYSDGYVNSGGFYLSLCETDLSILEVFKKTIGYSGDIKTKSNGNEKHCIQKHLNIHSSKLAKSLISLGCVQNKTHILKYPSFLNEKLTSHFIRGYFDGDGCISKGADKIVTFILTGNKELVEGIQNFMILKLDLPRNAVRKDKRTVNCVNISHSAKKDLLKIYDFIYKDCKVFYMERKYVKFKKFLDEKGLL